MRHAWTGFLESIAVETNFATKLKYQVRPTQEAVAQGAANIIGGLTMCYPVVGSFSRSATNASYDSQSPMCNLITASVIMLTLLFFTKLFYYMPLNVLAAIVIVAALSLVDLHEAVFLWSSSKKEFCLLLLTFTLTAFAKLELGIYVSIALCAAEVLFKSTRPKVAVLSDNFVLVYLPGAAAGGDTKAAEMVPDSLQGHDILVVRVEVRALLRGGRCVWSDSLWCEFVLVAACCCLLQLLSRCRLLTPNFPALPLCPTRRPLSLSQGDLTFSAASSLKRAISVQFKEAMAKV